MLKLSFTLEDTAKATTEDGEDTHRPSRRPHQAFLLVKDTNSELETFFPLSVKETTGRAKVDLVSSPEIP